MTDHDFTHFVSPHGSVCVRTMLPCRMLEQYVHYADDHDVVVYEFRPYVAVVAYGMYAVPSNSGAPRLFFRTFTGKRKPSKAARQWLIDFICVRYNATHRQIIKKER